jgi:nitroreductase
MTISPDQLGTTLQWRYATKRFDPQAKIPSDAWEVLEHSLVLTPSSFGLQPWKFLVVRDPETRQALARASWNQPQVTEASHFIVLTARTHLDSSDVDASLARMAEVQAMPVEKLAPLRSVIEGFIQPMAPETLAQWNARQVYIALGQFMTAAAMLGIDTCPMEGLDPSAYNTILQLDDTGYTTVVACAAGYRDPTDKAAGMPKVRFPADRVIAHIG